MQEGCDGNKPDGKGFDGKDRLEKRTFLDRKESIEVGAL